jgi:endonuclease/exonuclease/phosphatase family metal-dependent hydrolase
MPDLPLRAITWNVFHGRDHPPDPKLKTLRSRLFRITERSATYVQVNRPLLEEFAAVLARDPWQLALLQEVPPRWLRPLCQRAGAHGTSALTARNAGAFARRWLAERNPDLIASGGGGSNQLLVRLPWRIAAVRRLTLTSRPQRRRMLWALLEHPDGPRLAVANLHATVGDPAAATREVELGASRALAWAGSAPLLFGGDLNLRPDRSPEAFALLRRLSGLSGASPSRSIDHLLVRGLEPTGSATVLPAAWRELPDEGERRLRLSDHAPVALEFTVPER